MDGNTAHVCLPPEAEAYVQAISPFDLIEIGGSKWSLQHEYTEKLNMQAVMNASLQEDEYVKEFLITYEKIPDLIQNLITTEIWKSKVFPELLSCDEDSMIMFPLYIVLYHEATIVNLLETVLFHQEATEAAEDAVLDLLDFCCRKLSHLVALDHEIEEETDVHSLEVSSVVELQKQEQKLNFDISMKTVSILRCIIDHMERLPLSVMSRLLNTHDVPLLLCHLIDSAPWKREKNGVLEKYVDNKWQPVASNDRFTLTKTEGQLWLSIFQLLMTQECQNTYEIDPQRKSHLMKLRGHLNEVMIDQLPVLGDLQRYLEQLGLMDPPQPKKSLVLEQLPEIRENILKKYEGKWKKIAEMQKKTNFNPSKQDMRQQAMRLANTYSIDAIENLISEPPKCVLCGEPSSKRCSRCQNEWYCRRECQVTHWPKHKKACNLLVEALEKIKLQEQKTH